MLVDLIVILAIIFAVARNWGTGFVSQFFSALGLIGGILLGRLIESYLVTLVHTPTSRIVIILICFFGLGLIGLSVGEYVGLNFKYRIHIKFFNSADNYLGSLLTVITVLAIVWLGASIVDGLPATHFRAYVQNSFVISNLNKIMPPAPNIISDLGKIIDPNGFPDVFIGSEPIPNQKVTTPTLGDLTAVVNADRTSVVRIEGNGCGGIVSGSGFVVANGLVATNAHVVAGISSPYIDDINGRHSATVIWFDPNLDLAILKTSGLAGKPLNLDLSTMLQPGKPGAVLGYPGGGPFTASPAAVMQEFEATGHNIYGNGATIRNVYAISASVIPGNSGGPLISTNGDVMGVVFAESTTYNHVGYALAMPKVASEINSAKKHQTTVSTGQCAV